MLVEAAVHSWAWLQDAVAHAQKSRRIRPARIAAPIGALSVVAANATAAVMSPAAGVAIKPTVASTANTAKAVAAKEYRIADAIHQVIYQGGWSVTLRVYNSERLVERYLRCTDKDLIGAFRRAFGASTVKMDAMSLERASMDEIMIRSAKDGAYVLAESIATMERLKGEAPDIEFLNLPTAERLVACKPESAIADHAATGSGDGNAAIVTAEGVVTFAQATRSGLGTGQVFEAKLETQRGVVKSFRGVDLQRQFIAMGVKVGDRIRVQSQDNPQASQGEVGIPSKLFKVELS